MRPGQASGTRCDTTFGPLHRSGGRSADCRWSRLSHQRRSPHPHHSLMPRHRRHDRNSWSTASQPKSIPGASTIFVRVSPLSRPKLSGAPERLKGLTGWCCWAIVHPGTGDCGLCSSFGVVTWRTRSINSVPWSSLSAPARTASTRPWRPFSGTGPTCASIASHESPRARAKASKPNARHALTRLAKAPWDRGLCREM